jgi:hypothetical protein
MVGQVEEIATVATAETVREVPWAGGEVLAEA